MMDVRQKRQCRLFLVIWLLMVCVCTPLLSHADQSASEGPGWDTPEAAVSFYLEGLQEQDVDKMIGAYAVETYVDQFDLTAQITRIGVHTTSMTPNMPNANHLLRTINIEARKNEIVQFVLYHMISICLPGQDFSQLTTFENESVDVEAKAFVEGLQQGFNSVDFSTLKILLFVEPELISELYASERNQQNMKAQIAPYGAEEARSVVALFTIDDKLYVLCCDVMRYGDLWYIFRPGGNIGQLIGLSVTSRGMAAISLEDIAPIQKNLDGTELEGLNAILSELTLLLE